MRVPESEFGWRFSNELALVAPSVTRMDANRVPLLIRLAKVMVSGPCDPLQMKVEA